MKILKFVGIGLLAVLLIGGAYVYLSLRSIEVEQLTDDLWVLRGMGGNTAVLRTDAGAVVVDTMTLPLQGARIRDVAKELTGMETIMLINTHYHLDHTHGNPAFEAGTTVWSTARTLSHLNALDAEFWAGDAAQLLPNETFEDRHTLTVGGKQIELVHPGRGHTDGDLVVVFVEDSAAHLGDLMFNRSYPNIDLEAGGSIAEWPATLDAVLGLEFDLVIPGHGETMDRDGVRQFQQFMAQLGQVGRQAAAAGDTLEMVVASDALTEDAGYEALTMGGIPIGLDRAFVLRRTWEEATGNFELLN